jgi:hypothetical protein
MSRLLTISFITFMFCVQIWLRTLVPLFTLNCISISILFVLSCHEIVRPSTDYYFFLSSLDSLSVVYSNLGRSKLKHASVV